VEELLFGRRALDGRDELQVVHQPDVPVAVLAPELLAPALADGGDDLVHEVLSGNVHHLRRGVLPAHMVADGLHEMGLAQTNLAVNEQRGIRAAGRPRHLVRGGMGETVAVRHHEVLEGVAWI